MDTSNKTTDVPVDIPPSAITVGLSIFNTTRLTNLPASQCMEPIYDGMSTYNAPSYSYLLEHEPSGKKLIFDLGVAKAWQSMMSAEDVKELTESLGIGINVKEDVADVLRGNQVDLISISYIIFSHHHYDHVGDPSTFPISTSIIVGPGFSKTYLPGYPTDPKSELLYDAEKNKGREIIELDFKPGTTKYKCLAIGDFKAIDFFGDGSFYLLDTPGHTTGHISALARTTSDSAGESTFVFLGGDIAHHAAVFRPGPHLPLPDILLPSPIHQHSNNISGSCPGEPFVKHHHRYREVDGARLARCEPFGKIAGPDDDLVESQGSVEKMMPLDAMENVFTIFAHDESLVDILEYFPRSVNSWKEKGWKERGLWRFLAQLLPQVETEPTRPQVVG